MFQVLVASAGCCLRTSRPRCQAEMAELEEMAESLEAQLKSIKARLEELKAEKRPPPVIPPFLF